MELSDSIVYFLKQPGPVVVSTIDEDQGIHCSAKGIVGIEKEGKVFIIDLYLHRTFNNLKKDPRISITKLDVPSFTGYTLQGKAKIVPRKEIQDHIISAWEDKIIERISKRLITGVQSTAKSERQYEACLPTHPKYLIEMTVEKSIDLRPPMAKDNNC